MKSKLRRRNISRLVFVICNYTFLTICCIVVIFPLLKVLVDSFDKQAALIEFKIFPKEFTLEAYRLILTKEFLYRPFLNSVITTTFGTLLSLVVTGFLAYTLTRKRLPGRKIIMVLILITMVFRAGIIPLYLVVKYLHLRNNLLSIIFAHAVETYFLLLLKNFFETIPKSIEESAEIDGATPIGIFFRIILPLAKAGLATIGLFYVVLYWNRFFEFIIFMDKRELYNFQVALRDMILTDESMSQFGFTIATESLKNAIIIVNIIPVLILYPLLQRHFVKGINLGAIKG